MARREYPFVLSNNLDKFLRIKQARMTVEKKQPVTLQDVNKDMAKFMGVSDNTINLIKSNNYNPSLVVAMAMAEYLETTVDELFNITRKEEKDS
ncbi:helix-turn-helix domain-containing protein [Bacillus licheniformis]|uniref:helix-turn-helix transcriptional regulator n=1 Tax=Bacillus TaxID=1386 RepID=UPI0020C86F69|nr:MULTISPECIES: helix-turn-helix domain-containing protein [Bacillus]MCP8973124.1 helix-turn-helix domain-containing protein [Bacillus licheniformis]MCY7861095.1 helix-turn-helix domain-containing protein [Bacillus haynesii]MCY8015576.1 helix-turn-helix domain-containing protein [Bacillus haynesii]MCY8291575.1 helix-turn-helix domain-containing protein [Bacillus haynesii]MCY8549199.1 helix-turn-helix domain-containing protein [Bacillus haynesii]